MQVTVRGLWNDGSQHDPDQEENRDLGGCVNQGGDGTKGLSNPTQYNWQSSDRNRKGRHRPSIGRPWAVTSKRELCRSCSMESAFESTYDPCSSRGYSWARGRTTVTARKELFYEER